MVLAYRWCSVGNKVKEASLVDILIGHLRMLLDWMSGSAKENHQGRSFVLANLGCAPPPPPQAFW
jgi:hypothetical protein